MLDADIKQQLEQYLKLLEGDVLLKVSVGSDKVSQDMMELVEELASMSPRIKYERVQLERTPSFSVNRPGEDTGIVFAGLPLGHEFTSLVLALLQVSGRPPKVEQSIIDQVKNIQGEYRFETYVSLTCNNCPEVVQALNLMSLLNPGISHTMIEGKAFKDEVESKDIMAVPTVYLNGEFFESGRMTIKEILAKLGSEEDPSIYEKKEPFDVLVIGGGPAGASAAIYAARKGVRTGIVAERFGGQILDTTTIENFISVKETDGEKLAAQLEAHLREYPVDIMDSVSVEHLERKGDMIHIQLKNGAVLKSKTAIIATGARWRNVGVPGEEEFRTKGVANCTHCDAPLFAGKNVAVIGGGNSGLESAIDLAGIANHVTVLEFAPELKADSVLQERVKSLPNVKVIKNAATKEITGTDKVNGLTYVDRETNEEHHLELEGVFVQIGLVPNTEWLEGTVEMDRGQIIVDKHGATNVPGVFAAGDCTDSAYKQIIISMGSGATAALGAFDYLIRH
ncbi:alkyl hydroperoxide reductase subunit F [Caldibacillus thermolactis]|uniref:Alkyl hydroperoxide reductase subunit F n=1 Tax=Pallidibacillus thermolactis TaxID=251051 RepID=A0ABT2WE46_9BACI|nr:alkyl hydroperoxide reductase subunit F [Pallidibacillus thermolactis]MCU9593741.1 alkyl hydroperoxide reductase subunit F [Pallidibacillus thermolactis]